MSKNILKDTLKEIDAFSKLIKESYVFDEREDMMGREGRPMPNEEGIPQDEMGMGEPDMLATDKRIDQIRMIALEGIQEFADDVNSEQYEFFKKVWLMCDKVYESGEKDER
jgi:hypothetical protein